MPKSNIYVVIPNWNGKELLKPCLDSVSNQAQKVEVIVVDNGSSDGSVDFVKNRYPNVRVIELEKNYGFTGGVNAGIREALVNKARYIALLNNDATVEPDWLDNLVIVANSDAKVGIVTSKILRSDKKHLDSTGDFYSIWGLPFPRGRNEIDRGQYDDKLEVFGASGGASLYKTSMLKEIGLFDQDFFAYFEDVDISFRAQLAGWKVHYESKAIVYHKVGATSSKLGNFARYHSVKNIVILYTKNMPLKLYIKYLPLFGLQLLRMLVSSTLRGHLLTFLKGFGSTIWRSPSTLKKRQQIQRSRKVSVSYIDSILYHHRPPRPPKL